MIFFLLNSSKKKTQSLIKRHPNNIYIYIYIYILNYYHRAKKEIETTNISLMKLT